MKSVFECDDAQPAPWWALALAWWFLFSPVLWMWPGQRALVDATVSAALFSPLFLARPLLRAVLPLLVLAGAAHLAYFFAVHSDMDEFFWITVLGAHASESWEYLQSYRWQEGVQWLAWLAAAVYCAAYLWRRAPAVQRRVVRAGLLALLAPWLLWVGVSAAKSDSPAVAVRKIDRIYPMRLPESFLHYAGTAAHLHTVPSVAAPPQAAKADVVVVVIGESASAERWSLLGYDGADTNAALRPWAPALAVLRVLANGNNTAKTVPVLLSGRALDAQRLQSQQQAKQPPQPSTQGFATYLDQARQAGFAVTSLSNQGSASGLESFFHIAFRQRSDTFAKLPEGQWDGALTPLLDTALQQDAAQPLLLTLHTYGSHPQPAKRYPPEHALWSDAYDNSIAYSSALLAQWIGRLEQLQDRRVVLFYISDHGLNLPDCGGQYTHGYARSAYEVPMLVWANERFQQAQPQWLAQVQAHAIDPDMAYDNRVFQATLADVLGYGAAYPSAAAVPLTALPERRIDGKPYAQMYSDDQCTPF